MVKVVIKTLRSTTFQFSIFNSPIAKMQERNNQQEKESTDHALSCSEGGVGNEGGGGGEETATTDDVVGGPRWCRRRSTIEQQIGWV